MGLTTILRIVIKLIFKTLFFFFEGCLHLRQGELRVLGPQEALAGEASCRQGRRERHEPQQVRTAHASIIEH
jgi:hypothetical protein